MPVNIDRLIGLLNNRLRLVVKGYAVVRAYSLIPNVELDGNARCMFGLGKGNDLHLVYATAQFAQRMLAAWTIRRAQRADEVL